MIDQILQDNFPSLSKFSVLRDEIINKGAIHFFKKGNVILREGQYIKVIPLLVNGLIKVYKEEEDGSEVLLYYIKPGESCVVSMTSLIRNQTSKVKAVVEEDAEIIVLPADITIKITKNFPQWNEFIYELFSSKYEELLDVITTLTFSNKDIRLLNYLKKQSELKGSKIIYKTHQEIALDLGASREVISRLLKKMEAKGELSLGLGEIIVKI